MIRNGRYLSAAATGVQRVASALIRALDSDLAMKDAEAWSLLRPPGAPAEMLCHIPQSSAGPGVGQLWEQVYLPMAARGRPLLNLCNTAPLLDRGGVVMLHDAQVFSSPQSYGKAFRAWYRFLQPRVAKTSCLVLTVSNYSKGELIHYGVADEHKIVVVPNGGDHLRRVAPDTTVLERNNLVGKSYILALSSTQIHKNIRVLFAAMKDPRIAEMRLVLAGRADAAAFARHGITPPSDVVFTGPVSDSELVALMRGASAVAIPSLTEGFGLPALEALNCGCPVVAASAGALPEVCEDAALYADPFDPDSWSDAVTRLAHDGELRGRLLAAGRRQIAHYTWRRSARTLLQAVSKI